MSVQVILCTPNGTYNLWSTHENQTHDFLGFIDKGMSPLGQPMMVMLCTLDIKLGKMEKCVSVFTLLAMLLESQSNPS